MAVTYPGASLWPSNLVQKAWALETMFEADRLSKIEKFTGKGINFIVEIKEDLIKKKGDRITFDILLDMVDDPVVGNDELKGNEEALQFYDDTVIIDMMRKGFFKYGDLEDLKSSKNMKSLGKIALSRYFRQIKDSYKIRALCGDTSLTYSQTGTAPTAGRRLFGGDATKSTLINPATDISSADWMGTAEISRMKSVASLTSPRMRGMMIDGKERFVLFAHPFSTYMLKNDPVWYTAQREALSRGWDNPQFKTGDFLGWWDDVLIYEDEYCIVVLANTEYRAVMCGCQAVIMAVGGGLKLNEDHDDYNERHGIGLKYVWGLKKVVYASVDYATLTLDHYAVTPVGVAHS